MSLVTGRQLGELADELGIEPGRILNDLRGGDGRARWRTGMSYGSALKARAIRNAWLARSARDAARAQPGHADDWNRVARALTNMLTAPR